MSERSKFRKPAAFSLDDPQVVVSSSADETAREGKVLVIPAPEEQPAQPDEAATLPRAPRWRRIPWGALFWSALSGLLLLATGIAVTNLIEDLYARAEWLGSLGLGLAAIGLIALLVILIRELFGLARLATIARLRARATAVLASDDRNEGRTLLRDLLALTRRSPQLARARAQLEAHLGDIIDGADLVRLAERELMAPLDQEARRLVSAAAKRVSLITAVSPRALVDMFFVLVTALGLVRKLAVLYGGRPGALGLIRLLKHVVAHLTVTGGIAVGDSLIQQMIGHGITAKLSARLGEGVLNGLLTARLGLAAIEVTRPLPFAVLARPTLSDLAGSLLRARESERKSG
jgi:putative membrane protein